LALVRPYNQDAFPIRRQICGIHILSRLPKGITKRRGEAHGANVVLQIELDAAYGRTL
jgi:hypothetical protein